MTNTPRLPDGRINWRKIKFTSYPMNADRTMMAADQRGWSSKRIAEDREANQPKFWIGKSKISARQVQFLLAKMGVETPLASDLYRGGNDHWAHRRLRHMMDEMKEAS